MHLFKEIVLFPFRTTIKELLRLTPSVCYRVLLQICLLWGTIYRITNQIANETGTGFREKLFSTSRWR